MKIYTRRGDGGRTALYGGGRVFKDSARVEAYGAVDELNAVVGVAALAVRGGTVQSALATIQADLFAIGSHLATAPRRDGRPAPHLPELPGDRDAEMESWIDSVDEQVPPLRTFIVPGGSEGAVRLHHARTVCRRAERRVVALLAEAPSATDPGEPTGPSDAAGGGDAPTGRAAVDPAIIRYLNRLSDYLFAAARLENHRAGLGDVPWETRRGSG